MKVYAWTSRGGPGAVILGITVLGVAVVLFVIGFAMLAAAVVVGTVIGAGVGLYRLLRGNRGPDSLPRPEFREEQLDPALEVFPERRKIEE